MKKFLEKLINAIKKLPIAFIVCMCLVIICGVSLAVVSNNTSSASTPAKSLSVRFEGEYKIAEGEWKTITDEHIPSTDGDVTLRGHFVLYTPSGEYYTNNPKGFWFNFYCNHVFVTLNLNVDGQPFSELFEAEHPQVGVEACGVMWTSFQFPSGSDGYTEIVISNPHNHGNESAIDQLLDNVLMHEPKMLANALEKDNDTFRYFGFAFVAIALVIFVLTVVAFIAKLRISRALWVIGFWILFTGGCYVLDLKDVFFWNTNVPFNTGALGLCQILSNFFLSLFVTTCFSAKNKKIVSIAQFIVGAVTFVFVILSAFNVVRLYDVSFYWNALYALLFVLQCFCAIKEVPSATRGVRVMIIGGMATMLCILVDFLGTTFAWWDTLYITKGAFIAMLFTVISFGVYAIISNYKLSIRTKEMEAELKNKSVAVMISQIQPHFLYNSLNSIAELCVVDPKRAEKATIDFSRYLRGNMGALNEKNTIEFEDELKHLSHYIALEKLRYGNDLIFEYDIREKEFTLPALTVQPLVENAVNHGIRYHKMKGKVKISSYSDDKNYYVQIQDDGVGFDPSAPLSTDRDHVGIANVKYRLDVMCGGKVEIESEKGKGTTVTILIPKEK